MTRSRALAFAAFAFAMAVLDTLVLAVMRPASWVSFLGDVLGSVVPEALCGGLAAAWWVWPETGRPRQPVASGALAGAIAWTLVGAVRAGGDLLLAVTHPPPGLDPSLPSALLVVLTLVHAVTRALTLTIGGLIPAALLGAAVGVTLARRGPSIARIGAGWQPRQVIGLAAAATVVHVVSGRPVAVDLPLPPMRSQPSILDLLARHDVFGSWGSPARVQGTPPDPRPTAWWARVAPRLQAEADGAVLDADGTVRVHATGIATAVRLDADGAHLSRDTLDGVVSLPPLTVRVAGGPGVVRRATAEGGPEGADGSPLPVAVVTHAAATATWTADGEAVVLTLRAAEGAPLPHLHLDGLDGDVGPGGRLQLGRLRAGWEAVPADGVTLTALPDGDGLDVAIAAAPGAGATLRWTPWDGVLAGIPIGAHAVGDTVTVDVDGNGHPDLVLASALGGDTVVDTQRKGAVQVWLGGPRGVSRTPSWQAGATPEAFGIGRDVHLADAGDVDGDGHRDLVVGGSLSMPGGARVLPAVLADLDGQLPSAGRQVALFRGDGHGLTPTPSWTARPRDDYSSFADVVVGVGDVDGDRFDDLVVGCPLCGVPAERTGMAPGAVLLYRGARGGPSAAPIHLPIARTDASDPATAGYEPGSWAAPAGDVDGDGHADILATMYAGLRTTGAFVMVWRGATVGDAAAPWTPDGVAYVDPFGATGVGDLDGDGYDDVIIAAAHPGSPEPTYGDVDRDYAVFRGGPNGLSAEPAQWLDDVLQDAGSNRCPLRPVGDVDGDGFADVVVVREPRALPTPKGPAAVLLHGGPGGVDLARSEPLVLPRRGPTDADGISPLGRPVDLDGDGVLDALVGLDAPEGRGWASSAWIAPLGPTPATAPTAPWTLRFQRGPAVHVVGDLDGDGADEVAVAWPTFDAGAPDQGRVWIYRGGPQGLATTPTWRLTGPAGARLGTAVAHGDLGGDGRNALVLGAPGVGSVWVVRMPAEPGDVTPWQEVAAPVDGTGWGRRLVALGDHDGNGRDEVAVEVDDATGGSALRLTCDAEGCAVDAAWLADERPFRVEAAADANGDGRTDVLLRVPGEEAGSPDDDAFVVVFGGAALPPARWPAEPLATPRWVTLGDADSDGLADLLAVGSPILNPGGLGPNPTLPIGRFARGTATGFAPVVGWDYEPGARGHAGQPTFAADMDGDGAGELFLRGTRAMVSAVPARAPAPATLSGEGWFVMDGAPAPPVEIGDLDGDGVPDLVALGIGRPDATRGPVEVWVFRGGATFEGLAPAP
ncbi:MAG: VCBS repeat-containing protein [Alphaproteobacteria bacterium]|nr:VCBS repeat-containing protein [Alphaproteobacteria bacterium]